MLEIINYNNNKSHNIRLQTYRSVLYSVFDSKEIKPLIGQLIDVRLCSQYQGGTTRSLASGRDTCGRGESSVATECEYMVHHQITSVCGGRGAFTHRCKTL